MTDRTPAPDDAGEPLDLDRQAREVVRGVRPGIRDGRETEVVSLAQSHSVGCQELWEACSTAEGLARWMPPVTGELREGGRYQLDGNAGGRILRCDPPHSFTVTWEFGGDTGWVTVTVEPDPDDPENPARARLTLEHASVPDPAFRTRYGPGATGVGWDLALSALASHLAGAATSADPDSAATDPAYQRFVAATATAWAEQDIVAGSPAGAARDAGRRTTAFFTGAPEPGDG